MASAEDVGKRLLGEVEECGFNEILQSLRLHGETGPNRYFNLAPLDQLLQVIEECRLQSSKANTSQPIVELMSLASGGGKTHMLYHLAALAAIPHAFGGKQECAVIIDTDGRFSVSRLATQIQLLIPRHQISESAESISDEVIRAETLSAMKHIHLFRPQSLASTIATLDNFPAYLFNEGRHYSFDRKVAFIALDSASAFYWQDRSEVEDATFLAKTTASDTPGQTSAYFQLTTALKTAMKTFDCAGIFTTWYLGPQQRLKEEASPRSFRPQIPVLQASLKLVLNRLPVRKFPAGLSIEGALREAPERQKAVAEARFVCFVNEWSMDERTLRRLDGGGFNFKITDDGLSVEQIVVNDTEQG